MISRCDVLFQFAALAVISDSHDLIRVLTEEVVGIKYERKDIVFPYRAREALAPGFVHGLDRHECSHHRENKRKQ